jgi:hypothetical protein
VAEKNALGQKMRSVKNVEHMTEYSSTNPLNAHSLSTMENLTTAIVAAFSYNLLLFQRPKSQRLKTFRREVASICGFRLSAGKYWASDDSFYRIITIWAPRRSEKRSHRPAKPVVTPK